MGLDPYKKLLRREVTHEDIVKLTEIRINNRCNRDLAPTDLLFVISGWRDGGLIQSVRAMPFDRIRRRHSDIISVGLPGSLDWYDEITVEIID